MALISVIIPIYNVEAYLIKCVESVLNQTYENLEIILVNDGSTDKSGLICNEFAKKEDRVSVFHKINGGLSDARNFGTNLANGDYIFYLDSDDYLSLECLETLYNTIQVHNAEIAQTNFYYDYPEYILYDNSLNGMDKVFSRDDAMKLLLEQEIIKNFAWGKLIRSDIAKQHLFPKGKYFEDTFWKFKIIHECSKYVVLAKPMLFYLQRPTSISGSFSLKNLDQLEGEVQRLDFLYRYYNQFTNLGLYSLKRKLREYYSNLRYLKKEDQLIYVQEIQRIENKFNISPTNKMNLLISRILQKIISKNKFIKIAKS